MVDTPSLEGLRSVRGQPHATALLARAVAAGRVASAYLFEGPEGVGKERAARALAQVTVCTARRTDGDACGACPPCRQVAHGTHVDVITLAREIDVLSQREHKPSEIKSEIVVEKVRLLQTERLAYHAHQGERWVIVRNAHELNASASNALLKTLEEPGAHTHFVLVTAEPALLLNTIRSRCQRVRFAPLDDALIVELLVARGVDPALAAEAARLADGSVARALSLSNAELIASRKSFVDKIIAALKSGRPGAIVDVAEEIKNLTKESKSEGSSHDEANAVLSLLHRYFRDEALAHAASQPRRATANAARAELVRQTIDALERGNNLNVQMAVESMLVRIREVRA